MENTGIANKAIRISMMLKAPAGLAWKEWNHSASIAQFQSPGGNAQAIHVLDVKAGCEWCLTMIGHNEKSDPSQAVFIKMAPLEKVSFSASIPTVTLIVFFETNERETLMEWMRLVDTVVLIDTVTNVFKTHEGLYRNTQKAVHYL